MDLNEVTNTLKDDAVKEIADRSGQDRTEDEGEESLSLFDAEIGPDQNKNGCDRAEDREERIHFDTVLRSKAPNPSLVQSGDELKQVGHDHECLITGIAERLKDGALRAEIRRDAANGCRSEQTQRAKATRTHLQAPYSPQSDPLNHPC